MRQKKRNIFRNAAKKMEKEYERNLRSARALVLIICLFVFATTCITVRVHAAGTVNVALYSGEKRTLTYRKGQKISLLRYGMKIRNASYKSSDKDVAVVSKTGVIRTLSPGKTIITVKARGYVCKYRLTVTEKYSMVDIANRNARNMKYFIFLNRGERKVYVFKRMYGEYRPYRSFPCCVGAPGTPTPSGSYSIRGKGTYFMTEGGNRCWYYSQIVGSIMFHSQIYSSASAPVSLVDGSMGVACSHGCVRLYLSDAKWVHDTIPYGTRVYIV